MDTKVEVNTEDKPGQSTTDNLPLWQEEVIYADLVESQLGLYQAVLNRDTQTNEMNFYLNKMMQLRKICNHSYLVAEEDLTLPDLETRLIQSSGKLILLDKLLTKLEEEKHRVPIFSQMIKMLDILEDYCSFKQYKYCRIDGSTDRDTREKLMHEFNKPDSEKFIFLLSTRAGGLNLNLSAAGTVILYDSDFNPKMDQLAIQKAHSPGQKKQVQVYRLITKHTIEEKIVEFHRAADKDKSVVEKLDYEKGNIEFLKEMIAYGSDIILNEREN